MRVRCESIHSMTTGEPMATSRSLTVGKEYVVLEVFMAPGTTPLLRLLPDSSAGPAQFDSTMFAVVSEAVPATWVCSVLARGAVVLGPRSWLRQGFWEAYYDDDLVARALFEEELAAMLAEDGRLSG